MSDELKCCPFCGNPKAELRSGAMGHEIVCGRCGCSIRRAHLGHPSLVDGAKAEVIADWNRRADLPDMAKVREAAEYLVWSRARDPENVHLAHEAWDQLAAALASLGELVK